MFLVIQLKSIMLFLGEIEYLLRQDGSRFFLMLQFEAVRSVTGFGEAPCDIFIIVFQMEDDEVERGADYFRIETFRPCGDADIQKCVVVFGNAVLENGMGGVQLLQETDESFTGGACRRDT